MQNQKSKNNLINKENILSDILKIIIEIYRMNKMINNKLINYNSVKCYLINYEWIKKFKEYCNYNKISKELDNLTHYYNYNDFDDNNKVKSLIEIIKKKNIFNINGKIDAKDLYIYPQKYLLFDNLYYYSNFFVINANILFIIKNTIKYLFQNDDIQERMQNYFFYIDSQNHIGFYQRDTFIEIGTFNLDGEFISNYLLNFNKIKGKLIDDIIEIIKNDINNFFIEMNIEKNKPEKQPLIYFNSSIFKKVKRNYFIKKN